MKLSAVIICFNEEKYVGRCIESLKDVADEILVVDSFSTDETAAICTGLGAQVHQHSFMGFQEQKNYAVSLARNDMVLSIDADEAISDELRRSILALKSNKYILDGYKLGRLSNYCGKWITHSAIYPEQKVRLYNRNKGEFVGELVHEKVVMRPGSKIGILKGDILHWLTDSYSEHISKINTYSSLSAEAYFRKGKRSDIFKIYFRPFWRFFYSYFVRLGFLDGVEGYIVSRNISELCYYKYIKLRLIQQQHQPVPEHVVTGKRIMLAVSKFRIADVAEPFRPNENKSTLKPAASVILATYNQPEWLRKVLWGYEVQTFKNFELIIADDGSRSETKDVIDWFTENSALRIDHIWHPDDGYQKCAILNKSIVAAQSDYLIFSDGDCIPRNDFVETHLKHSRPSCFLSGGAIRLPIGLSQAITKYNIYSQIVFGKKWLEANGLQKSIKNLKLVRNKLFCAIMNRVSPAKTTWNGGNASGWKKDLLAINGFNENLKYGGQDRELGIRLLNLGLKSKKVRFSAICLHLDHSRPYKTNFSIKKNLLVREQVKKTSLVSTPNGVNKYLKHDR